MATVCMLGVEVRLSGPLLWDGEQAALLYGLGLLITEIGRLQPYSLAVACTTHPWTSLHLTFLGSLVFLGVTMVQALTPDLLQLQPNHFPFLGLSLPEKEIVSHQRWPDISAHLGNNIPEISSVCKQSWWLALECVSSLLCRPKTLHLQAFFGATLSPSYSNRRKPSSTRSSAVTSHSYFCDKEFEASISAPLDFGVS